MTTATANAVTTVTATPAATDLPARCIAAALTGLSPSTQRSYKAQIAGYMRAGNATLDRETVQRHLRSLAAQGKGAATLNQALAALKRLAGEAADLGWIAQTTAAQIERIRARPVRGTKTGCWLNAEQAYALLTAPDGSTLQGKRDRAVLALLVGCGLRRSEACALTTDHIVTRSGRMLIANLTGKGGRTRTIAVPVWTAEILTEWMKELER